MWRFCVPLDVQPDGATDATGGRGVGDDHECRVAFTGKTRQAHALYT